MEFDSLKAVFDFEALLKKIFGTQVKMAMVDSSFDDTQEITISYQNLTAKLGLLFRLREGDNIIADGVLSWVECDNDLYSHLEDYVAEYANDYKSLTPLQKEVIEVFFELSDRNNGIDKYYKVARRVYKDGIKTSIKIGDSKQISVHGRTLLILTNCISYILKEEGDNVEDLKEELEKLSKLCREGYEQKS